MYIERLIISGFKSYREHTVIDGFDRYFNAITGPNGSGKSNILDAICFVLGIQNLSLVRAQGGLQELIYKQGQSGVTKASVEIVFNNQDKSTSPFGYEQFDHITVCRQITSGSASKYFINDHVANASRVHNLFHSVQLNINNPHFLIMQGKITQVLNMKPQEILGLIEEAAGIKMYQDKKEDSLRTLERKQKQLDEIDRIFQEELTPNLEKLRKEKEEYEKYSSIRIKAERMQKWVIAYQYKKTDQLLKEGIKMIREAEEKKEELDKNISEIEDDIKSKKKNIEELTKKKENTEKDRYVSLENQISKTNKNITINNTRIQQTDSEIIRLQKKKKGLEKQLQNSEESSQDKRNELETLEKQISEINDRYTKASKDIEHLESRIKDVNIGIADEGQNKSLSDEVEDKKEFLKDCEIKLKRIESNTPYLKERKIELERSLKEAEDELYELDRSIENCNNEVQRIQSEIDNLNFDPQHESQLINRQNFLNDSISDIRDKLNRLERELYFIDFRYDEQLTGLSTEPYGPVITLFRVKENLSLDYNLALQKTAGGKLFHVVIATQNDGKLLLSKGNLPKRYSFIPLNNIESRSITSDELNNVRKVAQGRDASLALNLIEYDPMFDKAMQFTFGQSFVCSGKDTARDIALNKLTRIRSVTTSGSIYDPSGVVSGGYTENLSARNSLIYKISVREHLRNELHKFEKELNDIRNELQEIEQGSRIYKDLIYNLDIAKHQLENQLQRKSNSTYEEARRNLENVNNELLENQNKFAEFSQKKEEASRQILDLSQQLNSWNSQKEDKIKSLEKELKAARKVFNDIKDEKATNESMIEQSKDDIKSILSEIDSTKKEIANLDKSIEKAEADKSKYTEGLQSLKQELDNFQEEFDELKKGILKTKGELEKLVREENDLQLELTNKRIELTQTNNTIDTYKKDHEQAKNKLQQMKEKNPWIEQEERFFGVSHTNFDFKEFEYNEAKEKLNELIAEQEELEGRVNKKVLSQCERAENEYEKLVFKKKTVEDEKSKIEEVIEELEIKKREAISSTHNKVTQDLKDIVSQVLPGTTATLEPPEGMEVHQGLELIVSFNNLQKSLTELSGGQRSLIALGLVLALLKFKPAPVYILDEVDSALDLSHTQNIGKMLRKSFQNAQFIVVSLKEGMWNNANVVFRTSFRDSNSHVQRTENIPK